MDHVLVADVTQLILALPNEHRHVLLYFYIVLNQSMNNIITNMHSLMFTMLAYECFFLNTMNWPEYRFDIAILTVLYIVQLDAL